MEEVGITTENAGELRNSMRVQYGINRVKYGINRVKYGKRAGESDHQNRVPHAC